MTFKDLGLSTALLKNIERLNYTVPYPIQQEAIPPVLQGKDVLAVAKTGSGKTASFALPILQQMQSKSPARNRHIRALVLVPTRELAVQVHEVFHQLAQGLPRPVKTLAVFGGVSINPQMIQMQGVEVLVATPGRLLDLYSARAMSFDELDVLVLDEADKMLNLGFKDEMTEIIRELPIKRQNLLFSATLKKDVETFTEFVLRDAVKVEIPEEEQDLNLIKQTAYAVSEEGKGPLLRKLITEGNMKQVLVFVSSTHKADAVVNKLLKNKIQATALHSGKSQAARTSALESFKRGEMRVLVATDLMSRGIDIPFLPYVINYELPRSPKDFVHRIGRTGRAENPGEAIALVSVEELHHFHVIQKKMGKRVELIEVL